MNRRQAVRIRRNWRRVRLAMFFILLAAFILLARRLGLDADMKELRIWVETQGLLAPLVYLAAYLLVGLAALPGLPLTLAGGAIFGTALGSVLISFGSLLGLLAAFLVSRFLAREQVARWLARRSVFRGLEHAVEKHGAMVVILTRFFPVIPYNILNYALGLTSLRLRTYVFWSWLCMLPGTIFYAAAADATAQGIITGQSPPLRLMLLAAAMLLLIIALLPWGRRRLRELQTDLPDKEEQS